MLSIYYIAIPLGWLAGSVINYLSDTLPHTRRLRTPFCVECNSPIHFGNYFIWPRVCSNCHQRRSARVWIVEILFILSSVWLYKYPPENLGYSLGLLLLTYFGIVTVIDLEHKLILHPVSIAGAILGLIIGIRLHGFISTILGGAVGFGIMLALYYLGFFVLRMIAKFRDHPINEVALGFGDVNLSGVIGLILGWPGIIPGIIIAILIGGIVSLFYIIYKASSRKYSPSLALPYGPFLVASAVLLLYLKDLILLI